MSWFGRAVTRSRVAMSSTLRRERLLFRGEVVDLGGCALGAYG
jgi:hypothetical protein